MKESENSSHKNILLLLLLLLLLLFDRIFFDEKRSRELLWKVFVFSFSSDQRISGLRSDPAIVVMVAGHLDIPIVSPVGAPRVLDQPVILVIL